MPPFDPFLVPVTTLRRTPFARRAEHRQGRLGNLRVSGSTVEPDAEAVVEVMLDVIDGGIEVSGEVSAPWHGECRRCLQPVQGDLVAEVRELYRPRLGAPGDEDDEETYPLVGDYLDLRPLARDALLLELPLAPLCRPDCAGLCPICGIDRNGAVCGCETATIDPRWAALEGLHLPD